MSRPARWECENCRRLLAEVEHGRLRIARSVEIVYSTREGCAVVCPGCEMPRIWQWDHPDNRGIAPSALMR